jgi:hypothetical protein
MGICRVPHRVSAAQAHERGLREHHKVAVRGRCPLPAVHDQQALAAALAQRRNLLHSSPRPRRRQPVGNLQSSAATHKAPPALSPVRTQRTRVIRGAGTQRDGSYGATYGNHRHTFSEAVSLMMSPTGSSAVATGPNSGSAVHFT